MYHYQRLLFLLGVTLGSCTYQPTPASAVPNLSRAITNVPTSPALQQRAIRAHTYAKENGLSTETVFLLDLRRPSGQYRFFVYNLRKDSLEAQGLVAHGSCNTDYLAEGRFSNTVGSGCSSLGHYRVSYSYKGRFGKAYKLQGLDASNSNAYDRSVVLHAYDCIPDREVFPESICNSLGCPMVSYRFLSVLSSYIERSRKPLLLWIYTGD